MKRLITLILLIAGLGASAQVKFTNTVSWGVNIGFDNFNRSFDEDYDANVFAGIKLDYIAGVKFNEKVTLGLGAGLRHLLTVDEAILGPYSIDYDDSEYRRNYFFLPVFANINFRFMDRKVSPFLALSAGYSFALQNEQDESVSPAYVRSGAMGNLNAGVSIRLRNGKAISAGPQIEVISVNRHDRFNFDLPNFRSHSNDQIWQFGLQANFSF